jgi:hypothetical protein
MPASCSRNTGLALAAASLCFYYVITRSAINPELEAQRRLLAELDAEASRSTGEYWGQSKPQPQPGRERR